MLELDESFKQRGGTFKTFRIGELFDVKTNPQLNKSAFNFSDNGIYPYFTRTVTNNGILGYVDYLDDEHKISGNSVAVGMLGMQFFYMANDFYAGQFTKTIFPKFKGFNEKIALYFVSLFNKYSSYLSARLVRDFEREFTNIRLTLPVIKDHLALDFMADRIRELEADRIRELEADRIRELEAYLHVTGLTNYNLTDEEQEILIKKNRGGYKSFLMSDIFNKAQTGDFDIQRCHVNGKGYVYVNSGVENQGIVGMTDVKSKIFPAETITVDMFGLVWYRDFPYKMATHAHVFSLSTKQVMSQDCLLYLVASMSFFRKKYHYNNMCNWTKMSKEELTLPVNNEGILDCRRMELFVRAMKKQVIKSVIDWKDREIDLTKSVVAMES